MTAGRLVYLFHHRPKGLVKKSIREGGPIEQWKTERGRREMEAAAWRLPSIRPRDEKTKRPKDGGRPVEVQVLTGRKFWYQTAFCLYSFALASGRQVKAVIHDDGSLDQRHAEVLLRLFPGSRVETRDMIMERLDELLPTSRFPTLRARRLELPLIKKITDIHLGRSEWRMFFDADLLFFRRPEVLIDWWDDPLVPLTSVDAAYAYGYSMELLNEIAGQPVYDFINTGLLGLKSDSIDWDKMEHWCRTLIERVGTNYYQEQALVALQLAGSDRVVLPQEDYLVYPRGEEAAACSAVMHHYVDLSKKSYFRDNWRRFAKQL
jgi:hypothetical protein